MRRFPHVLHPSRVARLAPLALAAAAPLPAARAQHPYRHFTEAVETRVDVAHPVVSYVVGVVRGDSAAITVEMRLRNVADTFRLAMAAHPEYDDRFWRYVDGPRATVGGARAVVTREDSALWRVAAPGARGGREVVVRWRVGVPRESRPRASWRPFVDSTGALLGGPHTFMYVVGAELAPAHVQLALPPEWDVATALVPTADPRRFFAPTVDALVDAPILAGRLRAWSFAVDGVPHRVAYWPLAAATPFDSAALVAGIAGVAREAVALFGRASYREYVYLVQDDAYGGLEHASSVTLGMPSEALARGLADPLAELAHEYVHAWNLVRIRPAARGGVHYRRGAGRSRELWFSEGMTMLYADLLARRAGAPVPEPTRVAHLEELLGRYLANAGNTAVSPETASFDEYGGTPADQGDYAPSIHTQGEVLGTVLDIVVRDATDGARSLDDVMRLMLARHAGPRGYVGADVERAFAETCRCDVRALFARHVRGAGAVDVNAYLARIGLRAEVTRRPVADAEGRPSPDRRLYAWEPAPGAPLRVRIIDPQSAWGRAGLHTNDELLTFGGDTVTTWRRLRAATGRLRVGDTARVVVRRAGRPVAVTVAVVGYDEPVVRVVERADATPRQRALRDAWLAGGGASPLPR